MRLINKKRINIQLFVREECHSCEQVENNLREYCDSKDHLTFEVLYLEDGYLTPNGKSVYITPALWVNGRLWSFGGFDINRFDERINQLINKFTHH